MRSLSDLLQSAQQILNRAPNSRVIIRDVFLRLSELTAAAVATNYPTATLDGIPQCPIDFLISDGDAWRAWMKSSHLYLHVTAGTLSDPTQWEAGAVTDIALNTTHRPSLEGAKAYYADPTADKIYTRTLIAGAVGAEVSFSDVPNMESKVALAAVASGCYLAELVESGTLSDFKYLQISKAKGGGGGFGSYSPGEYAGTGATSGGAGPAWANPGNVTADDNVYAACDVDPGMDESETLEGRQFGFAVPARSTVLGIEVAVGKYQTGAAEGKRRPVTLTWNIARAATGYPVCITMNTQVEVAGGDMAAGCSDLRVVVDGVEADRWIDSPNDPATKIWVNLGFAASIGVQHTIYICYGGDNAQAADNDYQPAFDLSTSTNTSWDYNDFGEDDLLRTKQWTFRENGAGFGYQYSGNQDGGNTDPWEELGLYVDSNRRRSLWIMSECEITNVNWQNGEKRSTDRTKWDAAVRSSTSQNPWLLKADYTVDYSVPAPAANNNWEAWSQNVATAANTQYVDLWLAYTTSNEEHKVESADATLTLDNSNTPTTSVGAEEDTSQKPRDKVVRLTKAGVPTGNNKAATGADWPAAEAESTYGGSADLWGASWAPADVNNANFGVDIQFDSALIDGMAYVDYVKITVTYQPNTDTSPHAIVVDPDYTQASMSWFDAVTLGNKDVIVISQRAYGDPVVMFYEDGAWSDPRPMLPADIVDNYTFLRISGMAVITDSDGDDVIWACGRIGRGGSSGLNSQEWDCVLRSKDGEHWTLDRYQYLCQDSKRSRLQVDSSYVFYPNGASIMWGKRTWLMGRDHPDLKWTITDDLAGWQFTQGGVSQPATGTTTIADHDGDYKPYKSGSVRYGIWAGYWLWRYAGFNGHEALLSTEGLDRTPGSYKAGDRKLQLVSRDVVMRQLIDWASDQDWQWLSQQKLYDDCDQIDHLYSVSGTQIEVTSGDLVGQVDQEEMIATAANELVYTTLNNEGIFIATKPAECRNYVASATFRYLTNTNGRDLALGGSPQYLGFGFGVVGSAHGVDPAFNVVAAYYDTKTDKLYLLQRVGDTDSNTWAQLAASDALAGSASENQRNRVELHRDGPKFTARILRFTQGSDATELAKVEYTWAVTDWICDQADDRGRVGVICNMDVTSGVGTEAIYITDVQAYDGDDPDKALEWTLEDIAAKAGVMDFGTAYSVDEDPFTGNDNPAAAVWLQDTDNDDLYQRDFDLTFTLSNQIQDGDALVVIAKANSKLAAAPTDGNLASFSGCKITYLRSGAEWKVQFHQTTANPASATKHNWVKIDEMTFSLSVDDTAGGKRARVVGYDDFYALYINNRWIRTFHLGPVFDHIDDGYDSTMKGTPGYIGVWREPAGGYAYYRAVTVDHTKVPGDLTNHPVLFNSTIADLKTVANGGHVHNTANGGASGAYTVPADLVFSPNADGSSPYDFEIEKYDAATGELIAHIRIPSLSSSVDHVFYLVYGDDSVTTSQEDVNGVWDADFEAVYHLAESGDGTAGEFKDSTSSGNDGQGGSGTATRVPTRTAEQAGYGQDFDGDEAANPDHIKVPDSASLDIAGELTLEAWLSPDAGNSTWDGIIDKQRIGGAEDLRSYTLCFDGADDLRCRLTGGAGIHMGKWTTDNCLPAGTTKYVAATYDDTNAVAGIRFYVNGSENTNTTTGSSGVFTGIQVTTQNLFLGVAGDIEGGTFRALNGQEDEVRISSVKRSANYFATTYNNYNSPSTFYTVGTEAGTEGGTNWEAMTVTQPELWTWTDGIIMDQRMNALAGMMRTIRDRRVYFLPRADGTLKISQFSSRDTLQSLGDQIYEDADAPTDRVATHVRVVGEEISDYVDHTAAADWGITFALAQCPSLAEKEGYAEAQKIANDSVSRALGRQLSHAARVDWEPEDKIPVSYAPCDGGPSVSDDYAVTAVVFTYRMGDLVSHATLREDR